jgi:hypothetical protein
MAPAGHGRRDDVLYLQLDQGLAQFICRQWGFYQAALSRGPHFLAQFSHLAQPQRGCLKSIVLGFVRTLRWCGATRTCPAERREGGKRRARPVALRQELETQLFGLRHNLQNRFYRNISSAWSMFEPCGSIVTGRKQAAPDPILRPDWPSFVCRPNRPVLFWGLLDLTTFSLARLQGWPSGSKATSAAQLPRAWRQWRPPA